MPDAIQIIKNQKSLVYKFELSRKSGNVGINKGNEMLSANDRMHFAVKSQITAHLRELAQIQVKLSKPPFTKENPFFTVDRPCTVLITLSAPSRRRVDPPNFYPTVKAIIDGMTDVGMWSDDNQDIIRLFGFNSAPVNDKKKYILTVTITPFKENAKLLTRDYPSK